MVAFVGPSGRHHDRSNKIYASFPADIRPPWYAWRQYYAHFLDEVRENNFLYEGRKAVDYFLDKGEPSNEDEDECRAYLAKILGQAH
jgi:hypothetical protein